MLTNVDYEQDEPVSLIHIPLTSYSTYVQPILQLLHPLPPARGDSEDLSQSDYAKSPWANEQPFLNVAITPLECSVVCSKDLAEKHFAPVIAATINSNSADRASISSEDFVVISVEGEGLEAGQRVLELTTPLALAGMYAPNSMCV
jgi:hypothetical protein